MGKTAVHEFMVHDIWSSSSRQEAPKIKSGFYLVQLLYGSTPIRPKHVQQKPCQLFFCKAIGNFIKKSVICFHKLWPVGVSKMSVFMAFLLSHITCVSMTLCCSMEAHWCRWIPLTWPFSHVFPSSNIEREWLESNVDDWKCLTKLSFC